VSVTRGVIRAGVVGLLVGVLLLPLAGSAAASVNLNDRPPDELVDSGTGVVAPTDPACQNVVAVPANTACNASAAGGGGGLVDGVLGSVTGSVFENLTQTVSQGAVWFLSKIAALLDDSTRPQVTATWFTDQYELVIGLAAIVILPLLLVAIADAAIHGRPGDIVKALFVYLPIAGIVSYVALELADMALTITDWAAAYVSGDIAADASQFLDGLGGILSNSAAGGQLPLFAVFMGSLFVVFAAFTLWIELILRTAAISLAVLFLPLAFATMVWPRVAKWASRTLRLLAALIVSKFFIVAVISLGASMLSAVAGAGGLEAVIAGSALLMLATFMPWTVWRMLAPVESAVDMAMDRRSSGVRSPGEVATSARAVSPALAGSGSGGAGLPVIGAAALGGAAAGAAGAHPLALSAERAAAQGGGAGLGAARSGAAAAGRQSEGVVAAATGGAPAGSGGGSGGSAGSAGSAPPPTGTTGAARGGYGPPVVTDQAYGPPAPAARPVGAGAGSGGGTRPSGPAPVLHE